MKRIVKKLLSKYFDNSWKDWGIYKAYKILREILPRFEVSLILLYVKIMLIHDGRINRIINKKIFFYPRTPNDENYVLNKIIKILGLEIVDKVVPECLVVNWDDTTFRVIDTKLLTLEKKIINIHCIDISKEKVDSVFRTVFGYGLEVDPRSFSGTCVKKNNLNARHDSKIIMCPMQEEEGFVYQRLVNNISNGYLIEDIRLPIFKDRIPFAYLKYRPINIRFDNLNAKAIIADKRKVITEEEEIKIIEFCRIIGLDYGELDCGRDIDDKKLYIFDVNNTPFGPPNHISLSGYIRALKNFSEEFIEAFLRN